jgi:hypothetical protein
MSSNIKTFSLDEESMFNLNTYTGRLKHFSRMTDMRLILLSENKLKSYQNLLENYKTNPINFDLNNSEINKQLWDARYGIRSAINSETGKILPIYARMCAFVPVNIPIAFGLMCLPVTKFNIMAFNTLNQSYNAMMNYANGSGTADSIRYTAISFALAITSSVGMGLFLKSKFSRSHTQDISLFKEVLIRFLPSCVAGFLNIFFMRSDYFVKGINVKDESGKPLGISKRCGAKAVLEGGLSRFILPMPLILNHFILKRINRFPLENNIKIAIELTLLGVALGLGLPCSIALFKQNSKVSTLLLEKELKEIADREGIEYVFYNKGL